MTHESRLAALNVTLPPVPTPMAKYRTAVLHNGLLYVSGHVPLLPDGSMLQGKVGAELSTDQGIAAARQCGLAIISTLKATLGSLDRVQQLVKTLGMVNCTPDFRDHPKVINGFSELMAAVFGEPAGVGARSAVGVTGLPANVAVEVECVFAVTG